MLVELSVKNLALIEELSVAFGPGANLLTGETGAGKSIVVGALGLLLGRKGAADLVRAGAEEAVVTGLFEVDPAEPGLAAAFQETGLAPSEELILKRVLTAGGRGRAYVNGSPIPLAQLAALGENLLAISGQHDQQSLVRPASQLDFLDAFGRHQNLLAAMHESWKKREEAAAELKALEDELREAEEKRELYEFQRAEIEKAAPEPGEDEDLWEERGRARNSARLEGFLSTAANLLSRERDNVLEKLDRARRQLEKAAELDDRLAPALESLEEGCQLIADAAARLEHFTAGEADPARLEWLEDRLNTLAKLKRKYGPSLAETLARLARITQLLDRLDGAVLDLAGLRRKLDECAAEAGRAAEALHRARVQAADQLTAVLTESLRPLGFPRLTMAVDFGESAGRAPGPKGFDQISFLFCPNPGEGLKPLARIASGGELSRVMLALRTAQAADGAGHQLLVFDEIDSGLGGGTAEAVAARLARLSACRQTIVITHLPRMAALPGRHFLVTKAPDDQRGRTVAGLTLLTEAGREEELARMLGGAAPAAEAYALARQLLSRGESVQESVDE